MTRRRRVAISSQHLCGSVALISLLYRFEDRRLTMRRWILRISGVFLFSSLFLTSPALADPHFSVHFGFPGVYVGFGPGYYPRYAYYPAYPYYYSGYAYYPRYVSPRYGYYAQRYYWGSRRYVRPAYYRGWHGHGRHGWRGHSYR